MASMAAFTLVAIDPDTESYEVGRPFIEKAGVAHKVDFREGKGLEKLDDLLAEEAAAGREAAFDFAFVDADKPNYTITPDPISSRWS
ncbi:hypothetical protein GUJ93_ZPchr0010g7284 [Zizania palustris]|uniref:Caffeoyl-CoA O-methyltransferase n=1 Tax=Zizania palustris TaxID=103762 RepID=A0A8J6BFM8_ZIZPA|nr:hypothetical protein GUJ93_ZPchr0010g7284 [Zizania palustris]